MSGRSSCNYTGHNPLCSPLCNDPSSATKSYGQRVQSFSIVPGGQLLGNRGGLSQCQVGAECHEGRRSFLYRVLDCPFPATCCSVDLSWCRVLSRLGQLSRLDRCSHGHVRETLPLCLPM